jgi:hypothetical protein
MNFLHKTEELSRFENELFLEFFAIKEYILHLGKTLIPPLIIHIAKL